MLLVLLCCFSICCLLCLFGIAFGFVSCWVLVFVCGLILRYDVCCLVLMF